MDKKKFLIKKVVHHLTVIFEGIDIQYPTKLLAETLIKNMGIKDGTKPVDHTQLWNETDIVMISYGDSITNEREKPLHTLRHFLDQHIKGCINNLHILPFFPYSSDDGFAVINFSTVNQSLGDWSDIRNLSNDYNIMADLVINHCSSRSLWFENFKKGVNPGNDYFYSVDPNVIDISKVVRPRTSSLLRAVETVNGTEHVWCTFSHDQIDLNFRNPDILIEFTTIIRQYLDNGIRLFRLDAAGFLWKHSGTNCLSLDQTHEIIRLLRTLIEHVDPNVVIITETNIPHRENLTYFGNANEAHCIYNFPLPPLLINTLITGNCTHLKQWMMAMPPAQMGTTYLNFIASHDGIGLRPAEGLLNEGEINTLIDTMQSFGGKISWRASNEGQKQPYEINITLFDALQGTTQGLDALGIDRFICAHAIMVALGGIPAIYIHSMLATTNDYERFNYTSQNRAINRHQWDYNSLETLLDDEKTQHHQVFTKMKALLTTRKKQPAFHPNAVQQVLHLGNHVFGFWRESVDKSQRILCIYNITVETQHVHLSDINFPVTKKWIDLISGQTVDVINDRLVLKPYQSAWITNHQ